MRNITTVISIAALTILLTAPQAFAATSSPNAKASKAEAIGVGSGAVIGAAAGGPVGFIIGAAIGAKLGDTMDSKNERLGSLENSLVGSRAKVSQLEGSVDELGDEIERLRGVARPQLVSLMQAGIAMDLLFRTDEAALADTTGDRLAQLAATLASMPDIHIQLDGFADERGDEKYNFELSEKRVDFVREQFLAAGVHPARIKAAAHGESAAQDDNSDSYALERRVSVKLFINDVPSLASNPE